MNNEIAKADAPSSLELGKWLGRREAFGHIAACCSAAEMESLRRIHDERLYLDVSASWDEFCANELHVSSRTVDRELARLRRFGPAFFNLRQLSRVTVSQYAAIAEHVSDNGIDVDGEKVELIPGNDEAVAGAVKTLLDRRSPAAPAAVAVPFDAALQRLRAAAAGVCSFQGDPAPQQMQAFTQEIRKLLTAAASWGAEIRYRQ